MYRRPLEGGMLPLNLSTFLSRRSDDVDVDVDAPKPFCVVTLLRRCVARISLLLLPLPPLLLLLLLLPLLHDNSLKKDSFVPTKTVPRVVVPLVLLMFASKP